MQGEEKEKEGLKWAESCERKKPLADVKLTSPTEFPLTHQKSPQPNKTEQWREFSYIDSRASLLP